MKKILIINTTFDKGGAAIVAKSIFGGLKDDFDIWFAFGRGKKVNLKKTFYFGNFLEKYIHVFIVRFLGLEGFGTYFQTSKLINFIKKNQFDVVNIHNIHGYYLNFFYLFNFFKKNNIKVIFTAHDEWINTWMPAFRMGCEHCKTGRGICTNKYTYPKTYNKLFTKYLLKKKRKLLSKVDITITPANWLKKEIENIYTNNHVINIYNGIDTNLFYSRDNKEELRQKYHIPIDKKIVVFAVANLLDENKNIKAILNLAKKLPDITFLGIGNGKIEGKNIISTGYIKDRNTLAELYSLGDLFVYTSKAETMPLVLIEAILSGLKSVTLDSPFYREVRGIGNCKISESEEMLEENILSFFEKDDIVYNIEEFKRVFSNSNFLKNYKDIFRS